MERSLMQRHAIVVLLILSITSSTMVVGCDALSILGGVLGTGGGGGGVGGYILTNVLQIVLSVGGAMLLDRFVGPLLGDPAGDLGVGGGQNGTAPADD